MVNPRALNAEAAKAEALIAFIRREHPDLDPDDQAFLDSLEGETDVLELIDRLVLRFIRADAQARGCKATKAAILAELAADWEARRARFEKQALAAKTLAAEVIERVGLPRPLRRPAYTFSITPSKPGPVLAVAEEAVPPEFVDVELIERRTVNLDRLLAALDGPDDALKDKARACVRWANGSPTYTVRKK